MSHEGKARVISSIDSDRFSELKSPRSVYLANASTEALASPAELLIAIQGHGQFLFRIDKMLLLSADPSGHTR